MMKDSILNYSIDDLKSWFGKNGKPTFAASQVMDWIYRKSVYRFDGMSNLSKAVRMELESRFDVITLALEESLESPDGETVKFLFKTRDNEHIETVIILAPDHDLDEPDSRFTLCVSSQIGCPLGCTFCATGLLEFKRNLDAGEIISQVLLAEKYLAEKSGPGKGIARNISNIVFMGMGEPLLNYDNVLKSIRILNWDKGYNLGIRHFTISTAGLIPEIEKLAKENLQIRLAVSLHSASQENREKLMPLSKKYPPNKLLEAVRSYQKTLDRRVTFEYILLEGFNDSEEDVKELRELTRNMHYNLNVIAYNPVEELPYQAPSEKAVADFIKILKKYNIPFVFRKSKGKGINAGCGQLGLYWKKLGNC
jgi:23S rRNA (adenine2503-C2)-methyltransferase